MVVGWLDKKGIKVKEIIVALVTPFDEEDKINYSVLDSIIEYNVNQGADGFFVGGSAGEGMLLTLDEKVSLFEYLSKYNGDYKLIANISSLGTKEAIYLAKKAKELNYYAVSSLIPYYYKHSMESIVKYYMEIMDAVDLPMLIYNFPINSGVYLDLDDTNVIALLKDKRVFGIKHTNRDLYEMERIMRINPDLSMYNGYDEVYLNALPLNIKGAIGSTFNVTTPMFKAIGELYEQGKIEEALKLQREANILMDAFIKVGLIPAIKYALETIGFEAAKPRLPFMELDNDSKTYLEGVLNKYLNKL